MSNLHRIQWIDIQIRTERFPNCTAIAEKFEITRRQASRDIEYLRYSLGAPVKYDHRRNGYFYSEDGFEVPKETITSEDADLLGALSQSYSRMDTAEGKRIAGLFVRLYRGTGGSSIAQPGAASDTRAVLESCIRNGTVARIIYIDAGNQRTERIITPLKVFQSGIYEYIEGFCHTRRQNRKFRFDRIVEVEPGGSAAESRIDHDPVLDVGGDRHIVVETTPEKPAYSREPFYAKIKTGAYLQSTGVYSFYASKKLISWLLENEPMFEIVEPLWLRTKVREYFDRMRSIHYG